jgi:hypothetical protein
MKFKPSVARLAYASAFIGALIAGLASRATAQWTAIELAPTLKRSIAYGVSGGPDGIQIAGEVFLPRPGDPTVLDFHAVSWSGASASSIRAFEASSSGAYGVGGNQFVGYDTPYVSGATVPRASIWNGTSGPPTYLHPATIPHVDGSYAFGAGGGMQVGEVYARWQFPAGDSRSHAFLWSGSADSAIDLHPAPDSSGRPLFSRATATDGI